MYKRVLFGTDGSPAARRACTELADLATALASEVVVAAVAVAHDQAVSAWSDEPTDHAIPAEEAQRWAEEGADLLRQQGIETSIRVLQGHAAEALAKEATTGDYDLVVVGHRGAHESPSARLGSVAAELARLDRAWPLLIVP